MPRWKKDPKKPQHRALVGMRREWSFDTSAAGAVPKPAPIDEVPMSRPVAEEQTEEATDHRYLTAMSQRVQYA